LQTQPARYRLDLPAGQPIVSLTGQTPAREPSILDAKRLGEAMVDTPHNLENLSQIELRSIDYVPLGERHGTVRDQFTLWFGLNAVVFSAVLGGVPVLLGLNFLWSTIAIVLGVVVGLCMVGFHALQGPKLGIPQMIQSRAQFGFYGAVLFFAASIALDFGFLAAQLVIQAQAMNLLVGSIGIPGWIAILSIPVVALTIYGYDWIQLWQRWMTPILAVTFAVLIVQAIRFGGLHGHAARTEAPSLALFMESVGIFVIAMVSWAPYVSDYSRYLPASVKKGRLFWAVFLGCAIAEIATCVLGAYITALLPDASSTVAAVQQVAGGWALPLMALSLVGADAVNAYTGMLALASIVSCFKDVRSSKATRVLGSLLIIGLGTGCALFGYKSFVNNLANFLQVLLFIFIPWTAINLTDYFVVRRGEYDIPSFFTARGEYGGFVWRGLIPYALAVAAEVPFIDQTYYTGPLLGPLGGVDISWIVGGVAGVVFYLITVRFPMRSPPVGLDAGTTPLVRERPDPMQWPS
jgi:nucleobase:cation symporter-1, NCS1 family